MTFPGFVVKLFPLYVRTVMKNEQFCDGFESIVFEREKYVHLIGQFQCDKLRLLKITLESKKFNRPTLVTCLRLLVFQIMINHILT